MARQHAQPDVLAQAAAYLALEEVAERPDGSYKDAYATNLRSLTDAKANGTIALGKRAGPGALYEADVCRSDVDVQRDNPELTEVTQRLRETLWLLTRRHGFAALRGIPELQQLLAFAALPALESVCTDAAQEQHAMDEGSGSWRGAVLDDSALMRLLPPQLQLCLLAEVAAGLLCPSQPLPPDTPEHGAALDMLVSVAYEQLRIELRHDQQQQQQDAESAALLVAQLQHAPPPDALLDHVCQLVAQQSSSSSSGSSSSSSSSASASASGSAAQQADAELCRLMAARQPAVELCATCAATSSSATGSAVSIEALAVHLRQAADRAVPGSNAAQQDSNGSSSSSPCMSLQQLLVQAFQQAEDLAGESSSDADQEQPGAALAEQLQLLAGTLVMRFLQQQRAAGGRAWQQEVPLQAVALFAAVDQLHALAATHATQAQLQQGLAAAEQQAAGAVGSAARQQEQQERRRPEDVRRKPIAVCVSSDDESDVTESIGCNQSSDQDGQQQHQCAAAAAGGAADSGCLRVLQKACEVVQLTRQFSECNAAINAAVQQAGSAQGAATAAAVSASAGGPVPPVVLLAASGPLAALHPEPCGACLWAPAAPDASRAQRQQGQQQKQEPQQQQQQQRQVSLAMFNGMLLLSGAWQQAVQGALVSNWSRPPQQYIDQCGIQFTELLRQGRLEGKLARMSSMAQQLGVQLPRRQQEDAAWLEHVLVSAFSDTVKQLLQWHGIRDDSCHCMMQLAAAALDGGSNGSISCAAGGLQHGPHSSGQHGEPHCSSSAQLAALTGGGRELWRAGPMERLVWQSLEQHRALLAQEHPNSSSSIKRGHGAASSKPQAQQLGAASSAGAVANGCPLCQQEAEQAAAAASSNSSTPGAGSGDSGSGSGGPSAGCPYGRWAVPPDDPFMMRRLLWRLLGRLKPDAQAHYVQQHGMCPHCMDESLWRHVRYSLATVLWAPPLAAHPVPRHVAAACRPAAHWLRRARWVRQYARALTAGFCQGYESPAAALLSQQVLVALSPLHERATPQPQELLLAPASFGPAVAVALMQQLGVGHLWHSFESISALPQAWHVWWHVGLRRYHWQPEQQQQQRAQGQQQQRQQQRHQHPGPLSAAELDCLYADADARLYAAAFAARQVAPVTPPPAPAHCDLLAMACAGVRQAVRAEQQHLFAPHVGRNAAEQLAEEGAASAAEAAENLLPDSIFALEKHLLLSVESSQAAGGGSDMAKALGVAAGVLQNGHLVPDAALALLSPQQWQQFQQPALAHCDHCCKPCAGAQDAVSCSGCGVALYCSQACCSKDAALHDSACSHVAAAQERYAVGGSGVRWRLLCLLRQTEPGAFGTACGGLG